MTTQPTSDHWLLLRGLGRERRHWGDFPDLLEGELGAQVTCLDLPGFGTERERQSPTSVAQVVDDVRGRLAPRRDRGRWSILGISLGGMVALDWCSRFPQDFEACVTLNTSSHLSRRRDRFRPHPILVATSVLGSDTAKERAIMRVSSNASAPDRNAAAAAYALWRREGPVSSANVVRQMAAASRFACPSVVATPLLVLASKADRLVSWQCSQAISLALGAPLRIHRTAGHDLSFDDPRWVTREVADWIAELEPRRVHSPLPSPDDAPFATEHFA